MVVRVSCSGTRRKCPLEASKAVEPGQVASEQGKIDCERGGIIESGRGGGLLAIVGLTVAEDHNCE